MKLNQTELSSLAIRIIKELKQKATEAQTALDEVNDKKNLKAAKAIRDELIATAKLVDAAQKGLSAKAKKIGNTVRNGYWDKDVLCFVRTNDVPDLQDILKNLRTKQTVVTEIDNLPYEGPKSHDIYHDLVIAQIDSDNVEDLIAKVTANYIK